MINFITVADGDFYVQLQRNADEDLVLRYTFARKLCLKMLELDESAVYKTHMDFLRAGAKIIRVNTREASPSLIARYVGPGATNLINTAVKIAEKAVINYYEETGGDTSKDREFKRRRARVAGTCGSYWRTEVSPDVDEIKDYWTWADEDDILRCYEQRMQELVNAGVDLLILEDIPCRKEALIILELLKQFESVPAWLTFTCKDEKTMWDGSDFFEMALYCYRSLPEQIVAIGAVYDYVHCDEKLLLDIYKQIPESERFPLLVFFSGRVSPSYLHECVSLGVRYIMGNFNTSEQEVRSIAETVAECFSSTDPPLQVTE